MRRLIDCALPTDNEVELEELEPDEREVAQRIFDESDFEINGGLVVIEDLKGFENVEDRHVPRVVHSLEKKGIVAILPEEIERPSKEDEEMKTLILDRVPDEFARVWDVYKRSGKTAALRLIETLETMP